VKPLTSEKRRGVARFFRANSIGAEDDPMKRAVRILLGEAEQSAATANFNVIRMRAEA